MTSSYHGTGIKLTSENIDLGTQLNGWSPSGGIMVYRRRFTNYESTGAANSNVKLFDLPLPQGLSLADCAIFMTTSFSNAGTVHDTIYSSDAIWLKKEVATNYTITTINVSVMLIK